MKNNYFTLRCIINSNCRRLFAIRRISRFPRFRFGAYGAAGRHLNIKNILLINNIYFLAKISFLTKNIIITNYT